MSDITRESKIARNAEVLHREVEGETVLLDAESGTYFTLNETGSAIWEMIEEPTPLTEVHTKLLEAFEVSDEDAWNGILSVVADLAEQGLVAVE